MSDADQPVTSEPRDATPSTDVSRFTQQLAALDELPVAEHADVYQSVHSELQAALADIDGR